MPQLERIAYTLLKRISGLTQEDLQNRFVLARIERDIQALLDSGHDSDQICAYMAQGALSCKKKNLQEVRSFYGNALALAPNDMVVMNNFSTALFALCQFDEAASYAEKAYKLSRSSDLHSLQTLIDALILQGKFADASPWLEEWFHKSPKGYDPVRREVKMAKMATEALVENNVSFQDTERFVEIAYNILKESGRIPEGVLFRFFDGEILYRIGVNADSDTIVDLNFELADTLAATDLIPSVSRAVTVMYVPSVCS